MADKPASERTEKATPERLRKARKEGKIPQSNEVGSALMIIIMLITYLIAVNFVDNIDYIINIHCVTPPCLLNKPPV